MKTFIAKPDKVSFVRSFVRQAVVGRLERGLRRDNGIELDIAHDIRAAVATWDALETWEKEQAPDASA